MGIPPDEPPKSLREELRLTRLELRQARSAMLKLSEKLQIYKSIVVVLLIVVSMGGFTYYQLVRSNRASIQRSQYVLDCVQDWANLVTDRNKTLTTLFIAKDKALDNLIRSIAKNDDVIFQAALVRYYKASDDYNAAVLTNPVPEAPAITCALIGRPSPVTPSPTPSER